MTGTSHFTGVSVKNDVAVGGDAAVTGNASVTGDVAVGGGATVVGDATVSGTLTAKKLVLSDPVWLDLDFPIIIRTTGPNIPTLEAMDSGGNILAPQWSVNDFTVCEGQELVHSWQQGSTIYWHAHVLTNGLEAVDKYIAFEIEWVIANVNGQLSTTATIESGDLTIPADTPDRTMLLFSLGTSDLTGYRIGGHIWPRLKRVAATGDAPTDDPWCTMLQAHLQHDTLGSDEISSK